MSNLSSSSNKNHSKKGNSGRERDKNRSVASESGSSQCDTPPLSEKVSKSVGIKVKDRYNTFSTTSETFSPLLRIACF